MADLHELKQAIDRLKGVRRMVAVARDGTNLLRERQKKRSLVSEKRVHRRY